ncbi:MAG: nucleotidyltransferase domain-containing protein [Deltaproteobacteria bacterium]|nr:nucleotidyltransferase domain-containing protein [Deltaproteobacteria bacterium]
MDKSRGIISADEIKERLAPMFGDKGLNLVIVFGSVVTGKTHKRSDIDLAFLFENRVDILDLTNKVIRLLKTDNVDVVDLGRASPLLKFSAVKNGKVIYEREQGIFSDFYSLAFRRCVDTKKLRDAGSVMIRDFLHSRGLSPHEWD